MTLPPDRLKAVYEYKFSFGPATGRSLMNSELRMPGDKFVEHHAEWNVTLETSLMDRLIDWKIRSPAMSRGMKTASTATQEDLMIRQFTIELRVNYADTDKNETMRSACAAAARHMFATANLLADGTKPDIAIFSDDWFAGKEEISLMQDVIAQGLEETEGQITEGEVSSELMKAVMGGDGA